MTWRQSNYQWSGGIAAHPPKKTASAKIRWKNSSFDFFWDQDGILHTDYLPKGQTINAQYYSYLLVQLKDILKEKRLGEVIKGVLFLYDNAPVHRAYSFLITHPIFRIWPSRTTTCSLD